MSSEASVLALRLGHAAAKEAPHTEEGLVGVIKYGLMKEGYSLKAAEALAEEAARAVFSTLSIPTLRACEAEAALFGWADPGHKYRECPELQPPPSPLSSQLQATAIGETFALF